MIDTNSDNDRSIEFAAGRLRQNISLLPIPGAPPRHSRGGGDLGLVFLTTALRLNHVTRVTEQIEILETASARRRVSLDVSLRLLDSAQVAAGHRLNEIRGDGRLPRPASTVPDAHARGPLIWVPIARLSRHAVAPVEVHDAEGRLLPRLTQAETLQLMQAGLNRTLRDILKAKPIASESSSSLYHFLHYRDEARWLVEAALAQTIISGAILNEDSLDLPAARNLPQARADALKALEAMQGDGDDAFYKLLSLCIKDYLVIVGLDGAKDEHHLSYEGPLLLARERRRQRPFSVLDPRRAGIVVEYVTPISSGPVSYHLTVDVAPDVHICKFLLRTTHDGAEAHDLSLRLRALAEYLDAHATDPEVVRSSKVIEYELQEVFARLSLLTRARQDDWTSIASRTKPSPMQHGPLEELVRISTAFAAGELTKLAESSWATPLELRRLADLIDTSQLGADVVVENDPRESGAHVYWRNSRIGGSPSLDPDRATTRMQLIDDSPSLIGSVLLTTAALACIVFGIAAFALHSVVWMVPGTRVVSPQLSQADAIVAVLLLTPAFLFTRLDLPSSRTVIGALRELPRILAVVAVASTTYGAVAISTGIDNPTSARVHFGISLSLLIIVIGVGLIHRAAIRSALRQPNLSNLDAPRWLVDSMKTDEVPRAADIVFHAVGAFDIVGERSASSRETT